MFISLGVSMKGACHDAPRSTPTYQRKGGKGGTREGRGGGGRGVEGKRTGIGKEGGDRPRDVETRQLWTVARGAELFGVGEEASLSQNMHLCVAGLNFNRGSVKGQGTPWPAEDRYPLCGGGGLPTHSGRYNKP